MGYSGIPFAITYYYAGEVSNRERIRPPCYGVSTSSIISLKILSDTEYSTINLIVPQYVYTIDY